MPLSLLPDILLRFDPFSKMKTHFRTIKLPTYLPTPKGMVKKRDIIEFDLNDKKIELSPLPGLSKENLEDAHRQLLPLLKSISKIKKTHLDHFESDMTLPLFGLSEKILPPSFKGQLLPSVLFTLEQYLWQTIDHSLLEKKLTEINNQKLFSHTLIPDLKEHSLSLRPHHTYKIKIGKYPLEKEALIINHMMNSSSHTRLRLDGNLTFSQKKFTDFLSLLSRDSLDAIDYFEDPLKDLQTYQGPVFSLALDENLHLVNEVSHNQKINLKALVYKPTTQGGISGVFKILLTRFSGNIPLILSSSYEGKRGADFIEILAKISDLSSLSKNKHGLVRLE